VELLQQTECLDYVSPDVEACIEKQSRMEGNQDLDLTGREFIDSPFIPKLPPLIAIDAERATVLKPIAQPQRAYTQCLRSLVEANATFVSCCGRQCAAASRTAREIPSSATAECSQPSALS
jgi:hypothetical protein